MSQRRSNGPRRISQSQLARFGLQLVRRKPLVVRCATCGVEWRPIRLARGEQSDTVWHCRNCWEEPAA